MKSTVYPGLERKPGGPDNWVEATGGLPSYIERIAKHLHYEKGMSIQHAIATAVNTVKRWARKGGVVKYNDPHNKKVTTITAAQAAAAVAQWEAMKARAGAGSRRSGRISIRSIKLSEGQMDVTALVERANAMSDPLAKTRARKAIIDLSFKPGGPSMKVRKKLAAKGQAMPGGSFPIDDVTQLKKAIKAYGRAKDKAAAKAHIIKRARALGATSLLPKTWTVSLSNVDLALTKDGRKSFKRQGKWKHGFVPVDAKAKQAKAKGSPIAAKRVNRLFGSPTKQDIASRAAVKRTLEQRARKGEVHGKQIRSTTGVKGGGQSERVQRVGQALHADIRDAKPSHRANKSRTLPELGKGGRRVSARATQPWDQIPESEKTVRNGKKYVMATFNGRNLLTEWVGNNPVVETPGKGKRQYTTIRSQEAMKMSTAEIRQLLKSGKQSKQAIKVLRAALKAKAGKGRTA